MLVGSQIAGILCVAKTGASFFMYPQFFPCKQFFSPWKVIFIATEICIFVDNSHACTSSLSICQPHVPYLVFLEKRLHAGLILANILAGDNAQCVQQPGIHIISISEKLKQNATQSPNIFTGTCHYYHDLVIFLLLLFSPQSVSKCLSSKHNLCKSLGIKYKVAIRSSYAI